MLYLGFLQEKTIRFAPANLLTWKLNEDLVKKMYPLPSAWLSSLLW